MGTPIPTAIHTAKVDNARLVLYDHLLNASEPNEIALARAILFVLNSEWSDPKSRASVVNAFGGSAVPSPISIQKWHDHAVQKAKEIVVWEKTSKDRQQAYDKRRESYEKFMDALSKRFELLDSIYKGLVPGAKMLPFMSGEYTSKYMSSLRAELLAWFDRQRPTLTFVRQEPRDGLIRFLKEKQEFDMLLMTTHAIARPGPDRINAEKAVELQMIVTPALSQAFELYPAWDAPKILRLRGISEPERAVLAASTFLPAMGCLTKGKRLYYSSGRLAGVYGGDMLAWEQAISSCLVLSENQALAQALDIATKAFDSGKRPTAAMLKDVNSRLAQLVTGNPPVSPVPLEAMAESLWDSIKTKYRWMVTTPAFLDKYALNRILLMGIRQSAVQSQMLIELAESRIGKCLRTRSGRYGLGVSVPEDRAAVFVPGHAFRAGYKVPEIDNRQISDGVIGYWEANTFVVCAVLETKVRGSGGRELWFARTDMKDLNRMEQAYLRALANREWIEMQETIDRTRPRFVVTITDLEAQILQTETGSQVARDINRLMTLDRVRINGVLVSFRLLEGTQNPVKILPVYVKGTEQTNLEYLNLQREVSELNDQLKQKSKSKTIFEVEPFAVPFSASSLDLLWRDVRDLANRMVYCPGTASNVGDGCKPATSPADFLAYIRDLYARAVAYKGTTDGADQRVLEWLRHSDYHGAKWVALAGAPDLVWLFHLASDNTFNSGKDTTVPNGRTNMVNFVSDPRHPVNIKVSHLAASIDGALNWDQGSDLVIGDAAGWAGDLIQFYNDWWESKIESGSQFCRERLCRPDDLGTFKLRDLIEDADAFNISTALRGGKRTLVQELEDLFKPNGGYTNRLSRFFAGRFGSARVCADLAMQVLKTNNLAYMFGRFHLSSDFFTLPQFVPDTRLREFCDGFGKVLEDICAGN